MWEFIVDHPFLSFFIFIVVLAFINNVAVIIGQSYVAGKWAQLAKEENEKNIGKKNV